MCGGEVCRYELPWVVSEQFFKSSASHYKMLAGVWNESVHIFSGNPLDYVSHCVYMIKCVIITQAKHETSDSRSQNL